MQHPAAWLTRVAGIDKCGDQRNLLQWEKVMRSGNIDTARGSLLHDIARLMDGEEWPIEEGKAKWDCANKDLHAISFKATMKAGGVGAMIVRKCK